MKLSTNRFRRSRNILHTKNDVLNAFFRPLFHRRTQVKVQSELDVLYKTSYEIQRMCVFGSHSLGEFWKRGKNTTNELL